MKTKEMDGFMDDSLKIFDNEKTLSFIATVCHDGAPHITAFDSVLHKGDSTLMFGQYCQGMSKDNLRRNPKSAILAVSPEQEMVQGLLKWTERKTTGEEHELFNNIPRFRYNAVYGYAYIHLLEIVEFSGLQTGSKSAAQDSSLKTKAIAEAVPDSGRGEILTHVGEPLFPQSPGFKLLSYVAEDGYPRIIYVPQAVTKNRNQVVIGADLFADELALIPDGAEVAVLSLVPKLGSSIMVKGACRRESYGGADAYVVDIERVYSPNVPKAGYIYPMPELSPVRVF